MTCKVKQSLKKNNQTYQTMGGGFRLGFSNKQQRKVKKLQSINNQSMGTVAATARLQQCNSMQMCRWCQLGLMQTCNNR